MKIKLSTKIKHLNPYTDFGEIEKKVFKNKKEAEQAITSKYGSGIEPYFEYIKEKV